MSKGLSTHRHHSGPAIRLRGLWRRYFSGLNRRRKLHQEVHQLRRQLHQLSTDNLALAERNEAVERLSAELMRFNLDLSQVSRLDPMTGLLNRAAFEACLAQEHAMTASALAMGQVRPYSVIMIDVDHFKSFNDAKGHPEGDRCLVAVAQAVQAAVRRTDFVGRYGGEELIVLCPGLDTAAAANLAERLRQAVRNLNIDHPASGVAPVVTISLGLATAGQEGCSNENGSSVVLAADRMLYQAKSAGRDRVIAA
ncbi:diguanylate cyclase [Algisphaera agarilytica]|uniref:diguanylate cyclase n=1 Tax=Algisphaera agarilytica TaxID=1385975 RepID=A0A7X0H660_9BACT|nr:diguanylate cyclase [Algisphaera agarilytica]MBB6429868.1 diguanylate cyclase (GGDEF)-like protein [Algisphaera agarilytica]